MFHVKLFFVLALFLPSLVKGQHFGTTSLEVKALSSFPSNSAIIENYLNQFPETNTLTKAQKEWFYWTNYSRSNPKRFWDSIIIPVMQVFPSLKSANTKSLQKDLYNSPPLPNVKPSSNLITIAQSFSDELSKKSAKPSHTSPSGVTFGDRMKAGKINFCAGENISFGPENTILMLILLYIDEGVPELGHRKALLNPSYVEMGIGISPYPNNQFLVIQDFACDQKK